MEKYIFSLNKADRFIKKSMKSEVIIFILNFISLLNMDRLMILMV